MLCRDVSVAASFGSSLVAIQKWSAAHCMSHNSPETGLCGQYFNIENLDTDSVSTVIKPTERN